MKNLQIRVLVFILTLTATIASAMPEFINIPAINDALETLGHQPVDENASLEQIINSTQAAFLRPVGVERFEYKRELTQVQKFRLTNTLSIVGFVDDAMPKNRHYDHIIVLGATVKTMHDRLNFIKNCNVDAAHYWLATGRRPLLKFESLQYKHSDILGRKILTEADAIEHQFVEMFPGKQYTVVNATDGELRPNTRDSLSPFPKLDGSVLGISSQPHVFYQHQILLERFSGAETVGPSTAINVPIALDAWARAIFAYGERIARVEQA